MTPTRPITVGELAAALRYAESWHPVRLDYASTKIALVTTTDDEKRCLLLPYNPRLPHNPPMTAETFAKRFTAEHPAFPVIVGEGDEETWIVGVSIDDAVTLHTASPWARGERCQYMVDTPETTYDERTGWLLLKPTASDKFGGVVTFIGETPTTYILDPDSIPDALDRYDQGMYDLATRTPRIPKSRVVREVTWEEGWDMLHRINVYRTRITTARALIEAIEKERDVWLTEIHSPPSDVGHRT